MKVTIYGQTDSHPKKVDDSKEKLAKLIERYENNRNEVGALSRKFAEERRIRLAKIKNPKMREAAARG